MLRNGTPAPRFSLENHDGSLVSLDSAVGKPILLIFVRGKFCPTTDRFLASYQDFYGRLKELGVTLFAISTDTVEEHQTLAANFRVKFPLLSDPAFEVCGQYGMYRDERKNGKVYAEPGLVIIDVDGNVTYSVVTSGPKGLPSPGEIAPILLYMHFHNGRY